MEKILEKLMEQTEDCLKEYSKKPEWTPQDLECAYKAACMYDKLQNIKMKFDVDAWEPLERGGADEERSSRAYPNVRYGGASYARGRDAMTGRYVSRGWPYHDGYDHSNKTMRLDYSNGDYRRGHETRSMHSINDQMVQKLEMLMDQAGSDYERQKVLDVIQHIEDKK